MTDARATQVAVEEWSRANPFATVTQVALEEWGSVKTAVSGAGEVDAAATVAGAGALVSVLPIGAGEVDAYASVAGAGVLVAEPIGAGEVDAYATVSGASNLLPVVPGAGEVDAYADVEGEGIVVVPGTGEVDAYARVAGRGAVIGPPGALPSLPGSLGWSVHRLPTFDTIVAPHPSGSEVRFALWSNALWEFELTYDALSSNPGEYPGIIDDSLQALMGFFLSQGGQSGTFLFLDPDFNTATGQAIAAGDGVTSTFPFVRSFGGVVEPISWVVSIAAVYLDGVATSGWTLALDGVSLTFVDAPADGVVISADFSYGFVCRFVEDTLDFEEFMDNLWQMKSLKFRQVRR